MINELTQNEKQIKTGKPENIYYGFYKGRFAAVYSAMGNPDGYFRQQLKVRNIGGNKYNFNPDFIVVSKAIYDKHPEDYIKLKPYVDEFWDRINNESVNEELIMINENESEVEYLMSKFYEYRNLAAEAIANGAKEEAANFNKQAMEYYERAMDLEVANMSNSDLSPEDQAMVDDYEEEEANREVPRDYASMYENETKNNKMENINLNRWAKLAGINENEEIRQYQGSEEWEGSISGLGKEEHPQGFAEMRDIILSKYPEEGGSTYQMDVYYNNDRVATGVSGGFAIEKGNVYFDFKFKDGKVVDYKFDEQNY